jgi:glycosyltransferase involved in cell wall biosynthesis
VDQRTLGIVSGMYGVRRDGRIYLHLSFGRVVDELAARYAKTILCLPMAADPDDESRDYALAATNVELVPQPFYATSLGALRHALGVCRAYARVCRAADLLFVRGMLPYVAPFYALARRYGRRPCHWIVGNPVALLRSHRRAGWLRDAFSLAYAVQDRWFTRLGRWLTDGALVCNGGELGAVFRSPRTWVTVSSTISADDIHERADTCQGEGTQLLFVGFPRPEKGLQYLIEALPRIRRACSCTLTIVGAAEQFRAYRAELERLAERLGVAERICWVGYVAYGPALFRYLRNADILVLPTLSEGTPRVLVEARANGLPVIATNVGGIPTSVSDGHDGLLVPPKEPQAIAAAIERLVTDGELRRTLIRNGLASARRMTVARFVNLVADVLEDRNRDPSA